MKLIEILSEIGTGPVPADKGLKALTAGESTADLVNVFGAKNIHTGPFTGARFRGSSHVPTPLLTQGTEPIYTHRPVLRSSQHAPSPHRRQIQTYMPSLRETVAQVEAQWVASDHSADSSDDSSDESSEDITPVLLPVTNLASKTASVRVGGPLSVLLIHGLFSSTNWFLDALVGHKLPADLSVGIPKDQAEENRARALFAWRTVEVSRRNFVRGEDAEAIESCQQAIASGDFHAVVLVDLSARELFASVEAHLGPLLKSFASLGGSVVFTSCEGLLLPPTLERLFGTAWKPGAYYRTRWQPVASNAALAFEGPEPIAPISAKACCLVAVPSDEQLFNSPRNKRPASSVGQRVVCVDTTDTAESVEYTSDEADHTSDVAVARHKYGKGSVSFFGDAFCSGATVTLIVALCRAGAEPLLKAPGLAPGAAVKVVCLVGKPQHNGVSGTVLGRQGAERWQVRLDDESGTQLALKRANLELVQDPSARGGDGADGGDGGDGSDRGGNRAMPPVTYSPIRLLLAMMSGRAPSARGELFSEPWMNRMAYSVGACILVLIIALVTANLLLATPQVEGAGEHDGVLLGEDGAGGGMMEDTPFTTLPSSDEL